MKPLEIQRTKEGRAKLVNGTRLLELLYTDDSRPSGRTLRNWMAAGHIPYFKIGALIFYDPDEVLEKLGTMIEPKRHRQNRGTSST